MTGAVPDRRQDERACTTIGCENPGTVVGTFHDGDDEYPTVYCRRHATLLGDAFTPDDPAVSPVPGQQREAVARWLWDWLNAAGGLFRADEYAYFQAKAGELLTLLAATRDGEQA